jgi:ATP cone domain
MIEPPTPPGWVSKRDGSRVPFDADKISQALFAATESLDRPDAFLARELTDGVLHFLAVEKDDDTLTTTQIAEIVAKTVRELGQPALAEAFSTFVAAPVAARSPTEAIVLHVRRDVTPRVLFPELMRQYTQQAVYSRQVLAAQSDGLLTLTGLETPGELETCVVGLFESAADALQDLRRYVGGCAVFDGPEYALLHTGGTERFVNEVRLAARFLGLPVVVNLNCAEPPPWAGDLARGPLFTEQRAVPDETRPAAVAEDLLERFTAANPSTPLIRIYWHVAERDFLTDRLRMAVHLAAEGAALTFVFDRPRRPLLLAEGIDRQHSAVLLTVGLHLPRLAAQPGLREDAALFLQKLGSLTRLAISAAVQKREYLRRHERVQPSPLTTGFLLDRARLVVAPIGLDFVVHQMLGRGLTSGGEALDLGKQIVTRLRDVLKQDGRTAHLDACVDGASEFGLLSPPAVSEQVAGLTAWDANATLKNQLRAAGSLHALAERGALALFLGHDEFTAEGIAERLRQAWETSDVARLRLARHY